MNFIFMVTASGVEKIKKEFMRILNDFIGQKKRATYLSTIVYDMEISFVPQFILRNINCV